MATAERKLKGRGGINRKQGLALYRTMLTIRFTEKQLLRAHQRG